MVSPLMIDLLKFLVASALSFAMFIVILSVIALILAALAH